MTEPLEHHQPQPAMKFRFDADLEYQKRAIEAVVRLFEGTIPQGRGLQLVGPEGAIPNVLTLSEDDLLRNLQDVQRDPALQNGHPLPVTSALDSRDFSVEMETGTGKTYVYLRTALQLNAEYGFKKFLVIVPSVAIREGVLKTVEMTRSHFRELFDDVPYRCYEYDSADLARVRQFTASNDVEIMVMTLDSFNKDVNVFNRPVDRMMGRRPLELVQAAQPILILDEPQNMESEIARKALASLSPLFTLRYSASHRELYNLVYRLTPIDAYNLRLVKQIEVASVVQDHDQNNAYIECSKVDATKTGPRAKLRVFVRGKSGPALKQRTVRNETDLIEITKLEAYRGFVVQGLRADQGEVHFENGETVEEGEKRGPDHEAIARVQIAHTIEEHMRKAARLRARSIKVLSLFFIDTVASYAEADGYIRTIFEEEFERLKGSGETWASTYAELDVAAVQGSYFSEYKRESRMEGDADAYDLIMRDKERLLSFDEPVEFIFSHSALREGWDNPNIFQICTLNRTISTIRKRQEIGRGMRLAVNQAGERIFDEQVNRLTVVANESYREYVERLQTEYIEEVGEGAEPPQPKDARTRRSVRLKKGFEVDPEFQELWERIAKKTQYRVQVDSQELVDKCSKPLSQIAIDPVKIRLETGRIEQIGEGGEVSDRIFGSETTVLDLDHELPPVAQLVAEQTSVTRRTVVEVLESSETLGQVRRNPAEYIDRVSEAIERVKRQFLVEGIQYLEVDDAYQLALFRDLEGYEDSLVPIEHSIYDGVIVESEVERDFAKSLDGLDEVKLFLKLPDWFTVPTPVGQYNPDWAIVFHVQDATGEVREKLYLVSETKGSADEAARRILENLKIECAQRHFETLSVDYDVVTNADELRRKLS